MLNINKNCNSNVDLIEMISNELSPNFQEIFFFRITSFLKTSLFYRYYIFVSIFLFFLKKKRALLMNNPVHTHAS